MAFPKSVCHPSTMILSARRMFPITKLKKVSVEKRLIWPLDLLDRNCNRGLSEIGN
jgi:hypothetical protein